MSRPDHELTVCVLRDALALACDRLATLSAAKPEIVADDLETWRLLINRTGSEDDEEDPPFSEQAREAAWQSWVEAHARCGVTIKVTRQDRAKLDEFRDWWMSNAQMRKRGLVTYGPEYMTPVQQATARLGFNVEDD